MIDITHVHPMLVHFPLVLLPVGVLLDLVVVLRGGDLAARRCLPALALVCLTAGVLSALLAAGFGDVALDAAVDKGFDKAPLEEHEQLAGVTLAIFGLLVVVQALALWRSIPLRGVRAWILLAVACAGVAVLLDTAWHGGKLVYEIGVNVAPVRP